MNDLENYAKEYRQSIAAAATNGTVYEQVTVLLENQFDLLSACLAGNRLSLKKINFLKNAVYCSLIIVDGLMQGKGYAPSFRNAQPQCSNIKNQLLGIQIDIFVLLNGLDAPFSTLAELYDNENRKAIFIQSL